MCYSTSSNSCLVSTSFNIYSGSPVPSITSLVIIHLPFICLADVLYTISVIIPSIIDLSPLAPVFLSIAFLAIDSRASSVNSKSISSYLASLVYCLTREFFGLTNISFNAFISNSSIVVIKGNLPINSGIIPYLTKSSG